MRTHYYYSKNYNYNYYLYDDHSTHDNSNDDDLRNYEQKHDIYSTSYYDEYKLKSNSN